jgi:hypothetical protein
MSYTPKANPIYLNTWPYNLPMTHPNENTGANTPLTIGALRSSTIKANFIIL